MFADQRVDHAVPELVIDDVSIVSVVGVGALAEQDRLFAVADVDGIVERNVDPKTNAFRETGSGERDQQHRADCDRHTRAVPQFAARQPQQVSRPAIVERWTS